MNSLHILVDMITKNDDQHQTHHATSQTHFKPLL